MLAEDGKIYNFNNATEVFFVFLSYMGKYWYLDQSLGDYFGAFLDDF